MTSFTALPRISAWVALAALGAMGTLLDQAAAREYTGPTITMVRQSKERMVGDFLNVKKLPKTLSIDALTPDEVLQIQRLVYKFAMTYGPDVNDSAMRTPVACMQWIFLRHQPHEPWQTVSASGGGGAVQTLKVSGAFRSAYIQYEIPHVYKRSEGRVFQYTQQVPGPGPGRGGFSVRMGGTFSSPTDAFTRHLAVERLQSEARENRLAGHVNHSYLLGTEDLRVADKEVPCTHLAAKCRRYVGNLKRQSFYVYFSKDKKLPERYGMVELAPSLNSELAIEDMCPFASMALVQRPLNQRLSGGSGLDIYSINGNPGLPGALRPYAEGEKK